MPEMQNSKLGQTSIKKLILCIYEIRNKNSNKVYIGSTKNYRDRKDWDKYGNDSLGLPEYFQNQYVLV